MWNNRERSPGDTSLPPDLMNIYSEKKQPEKRAWKIGLNIAAHDWNPIQKFRVTILQMKKPKTDWSVLGDPQWMDRQSLQFSLKYIAPVLSDSDLLIKMHCDCQRMGGDMETDMERGTVQFLV